MDRPLKGIIVAILVVIGVGMALTVAEVTLRLGGFSYKTFPTVQFGWPDPSAIAQAYVPDRDLFWVTRDYQEQLAAARKSEPSIVFMGDSCTEFGTYPRHVLERLAMTHPRLAQGVKLGVGGWSTEQGLAQLKRDVLSLHPKIITLYFGWNDHWVALGLPDHDARPGPVSFWLSQHVRLVQLATKARLGLTMRPLADRPNRVGLDRYRANLRAMVQLAHQNGIQTVLITAPSNHVKGAEPAYLGARHLRKLSDLVPLHQAYISAARAVAATEGATLCDAAAAFDRLAPPRAQYFIHDGIHLSEIGNLRMAALVADCIARAAGD